jgi:hypothetical protein
LEQKNIVFGLENRNYWPYGSVALTTQNPLSANDVSRYAVRGGRSVGIFRLRTLSHGVCFIVNYDKDLFQPSLETINV